MKRRIGLGKVDYQGIGRRTNLVEIEVELTDGRFAASGSIWNSRHTDLLSAGQNLEEIARLFPHDRLLRRIVEIWRRWHLNDMRPGCEHQHAEGWDERPIDPGKPLATYGTHFDGQRSASWNMLGWVKPSEHPDGLLGKPCPVCGYRYGSEWRTEALPAEIVAEVEGWFADH